jgi:hypothetical protein
VLHFGPPQVVFLILTATGLVVHAAMDGQPLPAPAVYRFGVRAVRAAFFTGLLYWGGFFS